jgi:hypothetical protein
MVYLAKKNGAVIHHTNKAAMKQLDGIAKPDMEITEAEFEAAGGVARIINGEIFLGQTEAEKQTDANAERIRILKGHLAGTDYIAVKIAEGSATKNEYASKIAERQAWRQELQTLEGAA